MFLFAGIVLLTLSIFVTIDWGFGLWMTVFLISLVLCTIGIILLIIQLVRQIKEDRQNN